MYVKIGSKIKRLAKIFCILGIVSSVIIGVFIMAAASETGSDILGFVGIVIALLGSLLSWISGFLLYGFGELIELTDKNNKLLKIIAMKE